MRRLRRLALWILLLCLAFAGLVFLLLRDRPMPWVAKVVLWNHLSWNHTQDAPYRLQLPEVADDELYVAALGHLTVLMKARGKWIMTDPVLYDRFGPEFWWMMYKNLGPHRLTPLPVDIDDIPPVDFVLLSHAHLDHLCLDSLTALQQANPAMLVVVPTGTAVLLHGIIDHVVELGWRAGQPHQYSATAELSFAAFEVEHGVSRWYGYGGQDFDRHETSANGYRIIIAAPRGEQRTIAFFGDTGFNDTWSWGSRSGRRSKLVASEWSSRFTAGRVDLAILPIGDGYYNWNHIDPAQALAIRRLIGAAYMMPVGHDTFLHSPSAVGGYRDMDPEDVPIGVDLGELRRLLDEAGDLPGDRVIGKRIGAEAVFTLKDFALRHQRDDHW